jgi:hypothetical protein
VPTSAGRTLRAGLVSNDPERFVGSATVASNLLARNPQIFTGIEGDKEIEKLATRFNTFVDRLGMDPKAAAKKIMEMETPEYKSKIRAHLKAEDVDKQLNKEITNGALLSDMMSAFGEYKIMGLNIPGTRPAIERNPKARDAALQDYAELVKENYLESGNMTDAKAQAAKQMNRIWGVSRTNGTTGGVFMRYPPDRAPVFQGIPNASSQIAQQAVVAIKEEHGQDVPANKISFVPLENGQTAQPYLTRWGVPPYRLTWINEKTGLVEVSRPYVPDVAAMWGQTRVSRDAAQLARQNTDEQREMLSRTRRQQRTAVSPNIDGGATLPLIPGEGEPRQPRTGASLPFSEDGGGGGY